MMRSLGSAAFVLTMLVVLLACTGNTSGSPAAGGRTDGGPPAAAPAVASPAPTVANSVSDASREITREHAIAIARPQVKFEPRQTEAERVVEDGRAVWKVVFRGQPPREGGIGEYMEIQVDAKTGEIVSLGMS